MPYYRIVCVKVPGPALQVALGRDAPGDGQPLVILEQRRPSASVLEFNAAAAALGVRRGQRYSEVLALSEQIQAGVVHPREQRVFLRQLRDVLDRHSPVVEQWKEDPTVLWVHTAGLQRLYPDLQQWLHALEQDLARQQMHTVIAPGWTRPGSLIGALHQDGANPPEDPQEEQQRLLRAPVTLLPLPEADRLRLEMLGAHTIGRLLQVPAGRLRSHCSVRAQRIFSVFTTGVAETVCDLPQRVTAEQQTRPDPPLRSRDRLLGACSEPLEQLVEQVRHRGLWITEVEVELQGEEAERFTTHLRCADPTREAAQLARLLALRIDGASSLPAAVAVVVVRVVQVPGESTQEELFPLPGQGQHGQRDRRRINEAVAILEGLYGSGSVVSLVESPSWFPERSFLLQRYAPQGQQAPRGPLSPQGLPLLRVRRLVPAAAGQRSSVVAPPHQGRRLVLISSGWWRGPQEERMYEFLPVDPGRVLWRFRRPGERSFTVLGWVE